jgi:flavorubredoxin
LCPKNRIGFAFWSFGWSQGTKGVASVLEGIGWEMPEEIVNIKYLPERKKMDNLNVDWE